MNKSDFLYNYYNGVFACTSLILGFLYQDHASSIYEINKEVVNAGKIAYISNILLGIKEDLIENKGETIYTARKFLSELEETVGIIANKTEEGYVIDGYIFKDAPTLVATLRNKIAHGFYYLDLSHSRIILDCDGTEIKINIDKLCSFIVNAGTHYLRKVDGDTYTKNIFIYKNTKKREVKTVNDIKEVVKRTKKMEFTLKTKDGTKIDRNIIDYCEKIIGCFQYDIDYKILDKFKDALKPKYDFSWRIVPKDNNIDFDKLSTSIANILPYGLKHRQMLFHICQEVARFIDDDFEKDVAILSNVYNIELINTAYKNSTLNKNAILEIVSKECNDLYFNYNEVAATLIALFNVLFLYPMEDLYDGLNEQINIDFTGLDYSILDLSLFNIVYNEDIGREEKIVNDIKEQYKNEIAKIRNKINQYEEQLEKAKEKNNPKGIAFLISKINQKESELENNYENIDLVEQRKGFITNKNIIRRIRNSISHGNYDVKLNNTIEESLIIFKDIHDDKTSFEASISLQNFLKLIDRNAELINPFIRYQKKESKEEQKEKKLQKK